MVAVIVVAVVAVVAVFVVVYCCCCHCRTFSALVSLVLGLSVSFGGLNLQSHVAYFIAYYRSKQHRRVASSRQKCWFP